MGARQEVTKSFGLSLCPQSLHVGFPLTRKRKHEQTVGQQNSIDSKKSETTSAARRHKAKGKKWLPKKEEAFEHAHSGLSLSLERCLFSYETGITNSCRLLHLWAAVSMLDSK